MYERPVLIVIGKVGEIVLGGGDDWGENSGPELAVEGIPLGLDD